MGDNGSKILVILLFFALIAIQLLNWRAVVDLGDRIDHVAYSVTHRACGAGEPTASPCKVVVVPR